jgi:hypothetical protein
MLLGALPITPPFHFLSVDSEQAQGRNASKHPRPHLCILFLSLSTQSKRKEDMLHLEVKRIQSELRLERTKVGPGLRAAVNLGVGSRSCAQRACARSRVPGSHLPGHLHLKGL